MITQFIKMCFKHLKESQNYNGQKLFLLITYALFLIGKIDIYFSKEIKYFYQQKLRFKCLEILLTKKLLVMEIQERNQ